MRGDERCGRSKEVNTPELGLGVGGVRKSIRQS